jgi:ABC-type polar amino acid transport system ATPase subunit
MNLIQGTQLSLYLGSEQLQVLQGVDFTIPKGRITLFLGKSGSGKTTLLRCISNLVRSYEGEILFRGKPLRSLSNQERARAIGFVAQHYNLFPHFTVLTNCMQAQQLVLGRSAKEAKERSLRLLHTLGIEHLAERKSTQLSGGQAQRVAIARALSMDAEVLLLDEPTAALDPESTAKLRDLLQQLVSTGVSMAISTHDMSFARSIFDRGYFMEAGRIIEESGSRIQAYMQL